MICLPQVLSSYLQRASEDDINGFVRMRGYYQLANQLGQWPGTSELVEGAVSLVTGLHWLPLEEQLCEEDSSAGSLTLAALPPLLALLPNCVHNLPLSHHVLHFLQRLFTKVNNCLNLILNFLILNQISYVTSTTSNWLNSLRL